MRRAILISLGIVALVTGCGGGSSEPSASGEWTRHDIRDSNASVALPTEWKALEDFDEQTLSDFTKENEKFAPYVEPLLRNDVFKLFALDPDIEEAFATNLNVIVAPVDCRCATGSPARTPRRAGSPSRGRCARRYVAPRPVRRRGSPGCWS